MEENSKEHLVIADDAANDIRVDLQIIKASLRELKIKQTTLETNTAEIIYLYRGAGIVGKICAWIVGISGGIGGIILLIKGHNG